MIEDGALLIRDGLVHSVGPAAEFKIPADAQVVEGKGLIAYPGLIDAHTQFFLKKQSPAPPGGASRDNEEVDLWKKADVLAYDLLEPKKSTREALHKIGVTTVVAVPGREIFAGRSVVLNLNGENRDAMVLNHSFGLHLNFVTSRGEYPSSLMGTMALIRQSFYDARHYGNHMRLFSESPGGLKRPTYNPFNEILLPYVNKEYPVVFNCANLEDINRAVRLVEELDLKAVLSGANEAWRVADVIKRSGLPLLVSLKFKPPSSSRYVRLGEDLKKKAEKNIYPANAAELHKAGIPFALTSNGLVKASDIGKAIQAAVKAGLPRVEVLKALTIHPARILGIDKITGTLEAGKIANVILTQGELFEEKSAVLHVFADGIHYEYKAPPKKKAEQSPVSLNLSGKWNARVNAPTGELVMTAEFKQDGTLITGSLTSEMGRWTFTGQLEGTALTFTITADIMGQSMEMEFSGKADQDTIEGTIAVMGESAEFKATRIPDQGEKGGQHE